MYKNKTCLHTNIYNILKNSSQVSFENLGFLEDSTPSNTFFPNFLGPLKNFSFFSVYPLSQNFWTDWRNHNGHTWLCTVLSVLAQCFDFCLFAKYFFAILTFPKQHFFFTVFGFFSFLIGRFNEVVLLYSYYSNSEREWGVYLALN